MADVTALKRQAAELAVEEVRSGMLIGLGSGSTALLAVQRIAELLAAGRLKDVRAVPSSTRTAEEARRAGVPLISPDADFAPDLTIDGADEVDPDLGMIKGGGGALLREKILAQASRHVIIVVDESKLSPMLGTNRPVPVEVIPFGWRAYTRYLESLGARVALRLRSDGMPFTTDNGNLILDCGFGPISDPHGLEARLRGRAGIVENGLFLGLATEVIVAGPEGIRRLKRST